MSAVQRVARGRELWHFGPRMGLGWNPFGRPKPGHEGEAEALFAELEAGYWAARGHGLDPWF